MDIFQNKITIKLYLIRTKTLVLSSTIVFTLLSLVHNRNIKIYIYIYFCLRYAISLRPLVFIKKKKGKEHILCKKENFFLFAVSTFMVG